MTMAPSSYISLIITTILTDHQTQALKMSRVNRLIEPLQKQITFMLEHFTSMQEQVTSLVLKNEQLLEMALGTDTDSNLINSRLIYLFI